METIIHRMYIEITVYSTEYYSQYSVINHNGTDYEKGLYMCVCERGFPCSSVGKESACNVGTEPGSGRSPGEGNGNPLQYCCLENPVDRAAWWATRVGHDLATKPTYICVCSVFLSRPTLCSPMDCSPPRNFSGRKTEVGCHFLLQGIFPT